jgi:hypothetical protein
MKIKNIKINGDPYQIYELDNGVYTSIGNKDSVDYIVAWNEITKPFILDTKSKLETSSSVRNLVSAYNLSTNCTSNLEEAMEWISHLEENCKDRFKDGVLGDK